MYLAGNIKFLADRWSKCQVRSFNVKVLTKLLGIRESVLRRQSEHEMRRILSTSRESCEKTIYFAADKLARLRLKLVSMISLTCITSTWLL